MILSLSGYSVYYYIRNRMQEQLFDRLYFAFCAFLIVVFAAQFLVGKLGEYDAKGFMEGQGSGSYLTVFDIRGDRPDLEGTMFRVVIHRAGNYFVVPSDQTDPTQATLVVIPESEIISLTTEAVEP